MTVDILFDVDGTLITYDDKPRFEVLDLLRAAQALGLSIGVWSGGGKDYAQQWVNRLGLKVDWVGTKGDPVIAKVAIDDVEDADFGLTLPVLHVPFSNSILT